MVGSTCTSEPGCWANQIVRLCGRITLCRRARTAPGATSTQQPRNCMQAAQPVRERFEAKSVCRWPLLCGPHSQTSMSAPTALRTACSRPHAWTRTPPSTAPSLCAPAPVATHPAGTTRPATVRQSPDSKCLRACTRQSRAHGGMRSQSNKLLNQTHFVALCLVFCDTQMSTSALQMRCCAAQTACAPTPLAATPAPARMATRWSAPAAQVSRAVSTVLGLAV